MKISDFEYELPEESIAQQPSPQREGSKLMIVRRQKKIWEHGGHFPQIAEELRCGDLLVLNDTRVIPARLVGKKKSGGKVDALIVACEGMCAEVLVRAARHPKPGEVYHFGEVRARVSGRGNVGWLIDFEGTRAEEVMAGQGLPPLPPYIRRQPDRSDFERDRERYQTVYAERPGSIAAPTAGLHFTQDLLGKLRDKGVEIARVTLHVGPGTFFPVKSEDVEEHRMGEERYLVSPETALAVRLARQEGRRVVAVGTTVCRTLETAGKSGELIPGEGKSALFIYPPYEFRIVDALITNFHIPRSTLLLLVSAFAGRDLILDAYREAVRSGYRFYSYGDAMLIV